MTRPLFVTFNYEAWPLATHIELLHEFRQKGLSPVWLDMTGVLRRNFEFPISTRLHNLLTKRKLHHFFTDFAEVGVRTRNLSSMCKDLKIIEEAELIALQELISLTRNSKPCLKHNKKLFRNIKDLYIRDYTYALSFLQANRPSQLVLFNGRFVEERAFWNAARDLNCKVIFYETFTHTWIDRYFLFDQPTHSPSYRGEVMDNFSKKLLDLQPETFQSDAVKFFESRATGNNNRFTELQEEKTDFDSDMPIVSFFHSSQDELIMVNLVDHFWTSQEMALWELVKLLEEIGGHRLIIRIHPHLLHKAKEECVRWNLIGRAISSKYDWVTYVPADDSTNTYDLIRSSKIVVSCASTVGVEASYFLKPSILLGRAFHEDLGITMVAKSTSHLRELLTSDFSKDFLDESKIQAMKYGVFLERGGERFKHISVKSTPRIKYQFNEFSISKSLLVRLIQHIEIRMRNYLRKLKYSVLCDHDCGTNSSQGWKQRYST